jgi:plasmid maintenance system antidote protein VapI
MINTRKVKARMLELGLLQPDVAELIGINKATFNAKIHNKRRVYLDEVLKLGEILKVKTIEESKELFGVSIIFPQ